MAAAGAGLGVGAGMRLLPIALRAHRDLREWKRSDSDGSYICAWEAKLASTMLAHDTQVEARCDELARMLAVDKPPGTVIRFRFSSGPDPGCAIDPDQPPTALFP